MPIMKRLFLILALLVASISAHAQGTWSGVQSIAVPSMTHGLMYYQVVTLNYTGTGTPSPVLVYEHQNSQGDRCYPGGVNGCAQLATAGAGVGGTGVNQWFNTAAFQARYCAVGCIIISPYADQTSDPSGQTSNFGGYGDTDTNPDPNEKGVIAVIQRILSTMNADANRVYVTGDSLGGIGSQAIGLDYGINTGLLGHIITATMPFSGAIYRGGLTAPTNAQLGRLQGGGFQFNVNGVGDTGTSSNPTLWVEPLWRAITGNSAYPGQPLGGRAGSSPIYVLVDTSLGHDVWDTYRPLPKGQPMLDLLFAQTASGGGGPGLTGPTKSVLPSGYLQTSGNQIRDGAANNVRMACSTYANPTASPTADMTLMRTQGFNCAQIPWFDKVTCPAGVCNFTVFDGIVAAANAASMRIVFIHQANEGVNGSGTCTQQQANGLWYDLGGATNGTDGCGTAGTVTAAQFKSNWLAFASHYSGNQTVIGFDLHNEPTTFGNPACCSSGGGGGGTGQFQVTGGQLIDPFGNVFVANGINLDEEEAPKAITNAAAQPLTTLFSNKINIVRVPVRVTSGVGTASAVYPNPATYAPLIQRATALGIVVLLEDHDCNGGFWEGFIPGGVPPNTFCQPPTGGTLTTMLNFWGSVATMYKANPYVWIGSLNEICSGDATCTYNLPAIAAITTFQNALYTKIRGTGNNNIIQMGNGVGGGNPGTVGVNSGQNPTLTATWHNITWYLHSYYTNGTPNGALAQLTGSTAACCGGNGGSGYLGAQTLHSADGVVPVIIDECGSGTGSSSNGDASSMVSALGGGVGLTGGVGATLRAKGYGFACWAWFPSAQWQMVLNGDTAGGPFSLTTWGTQMANLIASAPAPPPGPGTTPGAGWGTGTTADMKAMVEDVGGAIQAADPGVLILVEGIFNNGNLFNGTVRGSSGFPITAGSIGDLSTIGTLPVACCSSHVVYSIHDQPTDLSGVAPDAGTAASTMRNAAWGYLETTNTAPVWLGRMGASLDNTNGQLTDENAWATGLTQYMTGQLSGQGGPAFTGCQEPMGGSWATFGYLPGQAINGTLNSDNSNKAGQQTFWTTMLYTQCSQQNPGGGGAGATTWNPLDASAGVVLTGTNLIATTSAGGSRSVRSTTSQTTGKVCFAVVATTISPNWDVGIANSSFVLTTGGGLGSDSNGIGFDPRSTGGLQGIFYNNAVLSSGAGTSPNGEEQLICADLVNKLFWATNATMRGGGNPWNSSATANPATGVGGLPFFGLTCPCFIIWNEDEAGVGTLNASGPFAVGIPAGFSAWQQPVTSGGHPMLLIFGSNDNNRTPSNDNQRVAFAQPMDLTR